MSLNLSPEANMKRFICLVLILLCVSCSIVTDETYDYVKTEFAIVDKFHSMFPEAVSKIANFQGIGSPKSWMSVEIVYDRYIVCCYGYVELMKDHTAIPLDSFYVSVSEVIADIELHPNGRVRSYHRKGIGVIKESDFMKLESIDDLFDKVGTIPITNRPVKNIGFVKTNWLL